MTNCFSKVTSEVAESEGIASLSSFHIAMGRGGRANNHVANEKFRAIVECYKKDYRNATQRWEKTVINKNIIQHVLNEGMVFVAKKGSLWFPVPQKRIYRKVAQALREKTPALKALPANLPTPTKRACVPMFANTPASSSKGGSAVITPSSSWDTQLDGLEKQTRRDSSASIVSLGSSVASLVSLQPSVASGGDETPEEWTDPLELEPWDPLLEFIDLDHRLDFEPLIPGL